MFKKFLKCRTFRLCSIKMINNIYLSGIPVVFETVLFVQTQWGWPHFQPQWQMPGWPWTPQPRCGWEIHSSRWYREGPVTGLNRVLLEQLQSDWTDSLQSAAELLCSRERWCLEVEQSWPRMKGFTTCDVSVEGPLRKPCPGLGNYPDKR